MQCVVVQGAWRVGYGKNKAGHFRPGGGVQERLNTLLSTQAQASLESGTRELRAPTQHLYLISTRDKAAAIISKTMSAIRSADLEDDTRLVGQYHCG